MTHLSVERAASHPPDDYLVHLRLVLDQQIVVSKEEEERLGSGVVHFVILNYPAPVNADISIRERCCGLVNCGF